MFDQYIKLINERLHSMINNYQELKPLMEYSVFPGGKRLRPLLVLTILNDLEIDYNIGLDFACVIELIHTYSLIHDDLPAMDNDEMRRNKLTLHLAHGEGNAILAGDALLTEAFYWLATAQLKAEKKIKIIEMVANYTGANGMIRGQYLDINNTSDDLKNIEEIHIHKTTDLFSAAIITSAIIGDQDISAWHEFALNFGKAYQIKDDIDDVDKGETTTIVRSIGMESAQKLFFNYRVKCLELLENLVGKKDTYNLVELVL